MERKIISGPGFLAVAEDGLLVEYVEKDPQKQAGDILIGKAERMMPGIGSVFVDIGRPGNAFLPIKENSLTFDERPIRSGSRIAVQIRKEEREGKGAFLTRDLVIPGKTVLLMPMNRYIGVSSQVKDEKDRERLKETGRKLADGQFGLVMRSASLEADPVTVSEETEELKAIWRQIQEKIRSDSPPGTVLYHADPEQQMIADYEGRGGAAALEAAELPADLKRQLTESRERKVRLPNGGNIVIDRCEAMTVIDVNSGSAASGSVFLGTNLSACGTIAAQIRLRNLSGIILIDFIDMDREEDRNAVGETLRECLERDRRKTVIHGWTKLGILEMTRKRV